MHLGHLFLDALGTPVLLVVFMHTFRHVPDSVLNGMHNLTEVSDQILLKLMLQPIAQILPCPMIDTPEHCLAAPRRKPTATVKKGF